MTVDPERTVNVAIQVLPLHEDVYRIVDRAIGVIAESGVKYEVGPMETVMEGPLDTLLEVAKQAHLACLGHPSKRRSPNTAAVDHDLGINRGDHRI
jgi:uncharacterized protein YqgV (UPF0045/DUF77 family)